MGRRWGKTILGGVLTLNVLRQHGKAAWIVPSYKNGRSLWRFAQGACAPAAAAGLMDISKAERMITTSRGGLLGIYSADNIDAMRGDWFHLAVIDEAARISDEARNDVILPTLADADGQEVLISTPKGMNWFYEEWQRGRANMRDMAAFHAPTAANPSPQIRRAAELARERVPARTYKQEWLAEFVTDGNYFQNIDACATLTERDRPEAHAGHSVVMGVDWGLKEDFTVITLLCQECSRVVDWARMSGGEYRHHRERLRQLAGRWHVSGILPERNSMGLPNVQELMHEDLPIAMGPDNDLGWYMTAANKPVLIEALALALERNEIKVPVEFADELRAFEIETRPQGAPKFGAPEGAHDDMVISLALAWQAALMYGPVLMSGV
jgi:hypothetical protein